MYDRTLEDGRVLSFGHAGILIQDSFVLYDRATDSWWVQATGEAYAGPLKGHGLRALPATVTTWAQWRAAHPQTTVLGGRRSISFMGEYDGLTQAHRLGLSVVVRFRAKLYPFAALADGPVVNDTHNGAPVVVAANRNANTAVAWGRTVQGRVLHFAVAPAADAVRREKDDADGNAAGWPSLRDQETGSVWRMLTGEAVEGPLRGARLPAVASHPILVDRFRAFYPDAPIHPAAR